MNETIDIQKKSSRRKYIITAGLVFLLLVVTLVFSMFQSEPKPDPASEEEIRWIASTRLSVEMEVNKKPSELSNEDFAKITKLSLEGIPPSISKIEYEDDINDLLDDPSDKYLLLILLRNRISNLQLLEKFPNLEELELKFLPFPENDVPKWMKLIAKLGIINPSKRNKIDLKPITKLKNLKNVNIYGCNIKSLKPLLKMKDIQSLRFSDSKYDNIKYISNLTNLQTISFSKIGITDLKVICGLTKLEKIVIDRESFTNLEPLKYLTNLQFLTLQDCKFSDLEPLKELKNLQNLRLSGCKFTGLEAIKEITSLQTLYFTDCPNITDKQVEDLYKALPNLRINGKSQQN